MKQLEAIATIVKSIMGPVFEILKAGFFYRSGKKSAQLEQAEDALKAKEKMDDHQPSTKSDVIDSLHNGKF